MGEDTLNKNCSSSLMQEFVFIIFCLHIRTPVLSLVTHVTNSRRPKKQKQFHTLALSCRGGGAQKIEVMPLVRFDTGRYWHLLLLCPSPSSSVETGCCLEAGLVNERFAMCAVMRRERTSTQQSAGSSAARRLVNTWRTSAANVAARQINREPL